MFRLCFLLLFLRPRLPLLLRDFFDVFLPLLLQPWPCRPSPGDTAPFPDKSTIAGLRMSPAGSESKIAGSRLTLRPCNGVTYYNFSNCILSTKTLGPDRLADVQPRMLSPQHHREQASACPQYIMTSGDNFQNNIRTKLVFWVIKHLSISK